jgi:hypothetical protein
MVAITAVITAVIMVATFSAGAGGGTWALPCSAIRWC